MKKIIAVLLILSVLFAFAGCGKGNETKLNQNDAPNAGNVGKDNSNVDVDLTALSSTMVYSEVYNMMTKPEEYAGKIVKMTGKFSIFQATDANGNPVEGPMYYACVISDATACCQQGLEFILAGNKKYPDDYPEVGSDITVTGEFRTYYEGSNMYQHLINAQIA